MKKLMIAVFICLCLSACISNDPDTVSLEATVQSMVNTAVAPYEEKMDTLVSNEALESSQTEQNKQIQQYIADQLNNNTSGTAAGTVIESQVSAPTITNIETSSPTITPTYSYTNDADCINKFEFSGDVTVPDGMSVMPNTEFTKSWKITNSGTCTWNSNYKLVYNSGDEVGAASSFSILNSGYFVQPGESIVVSANLIAPQVKEKDYITYWGLESDKGEKFGGGEQRKIYLSSDFIVRNYYQPVSNFSSLVCYDNYGYFTCGTSRSSGSRGTVYYEAKPTLENRHTGNPAIVIAPPQIEGGFTRIEFGPLRVDGVSSFYTNFCCKPESENCKVNVKLYVRELGYDEVLIEETEEWYDGFMGEWKFRLNERELFDQNLTYIIEVQADGIGNDDDLIIFSNLMLSL